MKKLIKLLMMTFMVLACAVNASAVSGTYSDPGGGTYWGNVYVSSISSGKSYGWCTGDNEDTKMNEFRGFECSNNGKVTTQNPWIFFKFRYNKKQSKDYKYKSSTQQIYVMLHGGSLHKIIDASSSWSQTDKTWGLVNCSWDGEWFYVRFAPNERGMREVVAMQVESESYYYQSNFWHSDYWFYIHARYLKGISFDDMSRAREAKVEWTEPGKVKVSADNSWLPSSIGNGVTNFTFTTAYNASVYIPSTGKTYSTASFNAKNRGNGTAELNVPLDQDFEVKVTRNTQTRFTFEVGGDVSQSLNENATQSVSFYNTITRLTASPNQVEGNLVLQWQSNQKSDEGEYQVYRTQLDENGSYVGNRELSGTTKDRSYTDNSSKGLDIGKYYRYEVFQKKNSWGDINIPTNPEPLKVVNAAEVRTSTVPVIPLHLVQDTTWTDQVKIDWDFGNVPKTENDVTFKVHRIEPNGTITRNYQEVTTTRTAGKASLTDEKPASACELYGYFLQLDLADNKVHLYSDTVYAHVLGTSRVTSIDATKGTKGANVVISWTATQVGTKATIYDIQRRFVDSNSAWVSIHSEQNTLTSYSYTDDTAEPGRYYEYRVVCYAPDCDGTARVISNAMTDVGFARASGVVSGRVQYDTGTAVPDARVTLTCESDAKTGQFTHSRNVLEAGTSVTITKLGDLMENGKPFTLQFMVNPDRSSDQMTLMEEPVEMNLLFDQDLDCYKVFMGPNLQYVVGFIPADEFSQISLISDGSNLTVHIAGNSKAKNDKYNAKVPIAKFFNLENPYLINEKPSGLDTWDERNEFRYEEGEGGYFVTNNSLGRILKRVNVSESLVGATVKASIDIRLPWGARIATLYVNMYDSNDQYLNGIQVCNPVSSNGDWQTYSRDFTIVPGTSYITYVVQGRDSKNWAGWYGPQFKNMLLKVKTFNEWQLLTDFTGNIDEIRLWNRNLSDDEIERDVDRIISGETEGLKALITFDEGLEEYAFDSSCTGGVPNGHHAIVGDNTRPSDIIPTEIQLSSYGITNDKGEYEIRGIPFTGSGTRYSVAPTKGIHKFSPTSRSAFIGGTSLTINNVDFTDVSSFKVSGTIRYAGTTIPVDSVNFYVDGTPCNKNDKMIVSDADGKYEISVPIGSHYIEARRAGHTFVSAGRYPAAEDETYEFLEDTHIDFYDNTLVTLAGRITGGETQGKQPLGYGVSENTIGKAEITLTPLDHPQRMLNAIEKVEGTTVEWVANPDNVAVESASTDINSSAYRSGGSLDDVKYIRITTDEKTGEFSALVPPIRYRVESIKFPSNGDLDKEELFLNVPALNLTNPRDTVRPDTLYNASKQPLPLFKCNKKLVLTYRSNPVMDITQVGAPAGVFGTDTITVRDAGKDIKLPLYTIDETTKKVTYNYKYPIFQTGRTYNFKVKAYEPYTNYDSGKPGKVYKDVLRDSIITFDNEMGAAAQIAAVDTTAEGHTLRRGDLLKLESGQIRLDSVGEGNYKWIAGLPNLSTPHTRNMNASMVINKQTKLWNNEGLTGICFGVIPTGNNFITAGPSHVQMVLRDPPGDASSATWATDSVTNDYTYTVHGIHNGTEIGVDIRASLEIDVATGAIAFYKFTYNQLIHENAVTWKYDINKTWDNHTSVTYTNSQATSTSSNMDYVGRDGDVFIGYSTNYIIGAADKVGLFKQEDGTWGIGMEETMTMDEKFNTHFEYSQIYIETTLFDNIKRTRNSMIKHINSLSEIEEHPARPTYYTLLSADDKKYGTSNNDKEVWGAQAKSGFDGPSYYARFPANYAGSDSVLWCNEIIELWKKTLADNEEDKLKAFSDPKYKIGNESFERGVSVTKSSGATTKEVHNSVENFNWSFSYAGKNGYLLDKCGAIFLSSTNIGHHYTKYDVDETTTSKRFSYTLNDTQRGNAHTVDIFNSPRNWGPIFRTRGGQTRCPYEGETKTKYYRPGQTLDYATMKSDNPHMSMPMRNFVDIPAGQEAQMQVVFTNESETHEALTSMVFYVDAGSNPNGLQIFMDGQPILDGTEIWVEYGAPVTKTLTIKQSDNSILDYNNVRFVLANSCKPAKWIYETLDFSAHFVPAAPPVTLKVNKNLLNLRAVTSGDQIVATISDINRLFTGLKGIRLKYRFAGDSKWTTAHEWFTDAQYLTDGRENETQSLLKSDKPNITYNLMLPNIDGNYVVAAESICKFGNTDYVNTTPEQTIIRDTRGPRLLGQAYPNTGILHPTDDIHFRFNEEIRESYLTKDENFFITGYLNGSQVDHQVSLQLNGNEMATDAYLPIANTSFAANLWLKRTSGGTLLEHGTEGNNVALNITDDGHASVTISDAVVTSTETIPANRWVFLALNYVSSGGPANNTLNLLLADEGREVMLLNENNVPAYNGNGHLVIGKNLHGAMHDLAVWGINRPVRSALAQKDEIVAAYLPGLVGYWRMNEGHGTTVTDYARSRNIYLDTERWNVENKSLAAHFDGSHNMAIDISTISPRNTDSYAIEFWFKGEQGKNRSKTLVSVTDKISIGFDADGSLYMSTYNQDEHSSLDTDGVPTILTSTDYSDGQWHHLALNVRRGIGAAVYVDGKAVKTLAEQDIPAPAGDKLYIGSIQKREAPAAPKYDDRFFTGDIDEVRIWNASTDGTTIVENRYNEVDTASVAGLIAYFPMQKQALDDSHNIIVTFSTANAAPKGNTGSVGKVEADGITQADSSPALKTAPLRQNLDYDFVANENEIFINLKTLPSRMHGNMITFTVKNVRDMADNLSETVTWSARADYNTLFCSNSDVEITKDRQEQAHFSSQIFNCGNENESYTISGLPTWITASHTEGTIAVNSSEEITFTVLESAPMGFHALQIYAVNSAGIYCQPIVLKLMVTGNEPVWTVNPADYESSMNVIGQIYIKDKICTDPYSRIAAFVDDKCCGVASPKLMASRDAYFVNMTIYGLEDVTKPQPITFRIYDASQGVVLGDIITKLNGKTLDLEYRPNNFVGNYDTPVVWTSSNLIEQPVSFKTGWNWISLYAMPEQGKDDLENVFGHSKAFNTVKGKDGFAMNSGTKWTSTGLETVTVGFLYKVKAKSDFTYNIKGERVNTQKTTQTIHTGWNWIGPLSIYNLSLGEAFADLNPTRGDIIKSKNAVAFYDGYKWEGDLTAVTPGVGYYYKSLNPNDVTFRYPTVDNAYNNAPARMQAPAKRLLSVFTPVDHYQFSDNMNVVARVKVDDLEVDTLTIAAFIGDECRGVTTATDEGLYMLTIAGNAEEAGADVTFATVIDGKTVYFTETLPWMSDMIYGDLDDPQLLTFRTSGIDDIQAATNSIEITPTLVKDMIYVRAGNILSAVKVYSVNGAAVEYLSNINDNLASLNLSHLPAGVYFVEAKAVNGYRVVKRIVKQ